MEIGVQLGPSRFTEVRMGKLSLHESNKIHITYIVNVFVLGEYTSFIKIS